MYHHPGNRPVNLNLAAFRFPLNAYLSILHRITGVLMVIGLIVGLWWLNELILFPENFSQNLALSHTLLGELLLFGWLSSLWFHWLAGGKHLLAEHDFLGISSCLNKSTNASKVALVLFAIGEILFAWLFWGGSL